ncbi:MULTISPECIES: response regulator [unclassified Methylobacterium]|uniref:response regulator n=1 Tax=unclassified Methylobacterium TaxID=2615210 RepID=UPI001FB8BF15|nr:MULTISPECIES: response regulator [unclassified Methylobacterium]MCJ2015557.1 response regulator [Methylobacterium sp. J-076]MCJ2089774.1 response regulator [Methylobacterium sp. E-005]
MPPASLVVLVVEDEPLQRMMAVDLVEDAGFEALHVASAADAVLILESRLDIRVVFTDIDMPGGLNGMQFAAAVRDRWPPIELIIVSGKRRPLPEELPKRGVFFQKPYKRDEVTATMQRMMA